MYLYIWWCGWVQNEPSTSNLMFESNYCTAVISEIIQNNFKSRPAVSVGFSWYFHAFIWLLKPWSANSLQSLHGIHLSKDINQKAGIKEFWRYYTPWNTMTAISNYRKRRNCQKQDVPSKGQDRDLARRLPKDLQPNWRRYRISD